MRTEAGDRGGKFSARTEVGLAAPFPWFGGKSRVAGVVWQAFGDVPNFVEPFFGSGAVLLGRPESGLANPIETVNDLDGFVANFWRAVTQAPEEVAKGNGNGRANAHREVIWFSPGCLSLYRVKTLFDLDWSDDSDFSDGSDVEDGDE